MAGAAAMRWESLKSERFDPFVLWRVVGEDMQLLSHVVHIFSNEYPGMLREIENAARARDGAALRKASHKLKGSLLQFSAPLAASAAAELEDCGNHGSMENAPASIETVKKETDYVIQMLQAMVANQQPGAKAEEEIQD
jgi:HPt (histidine-containing phosphotransfer) domain-containing protein